jgi:hypothetical protein
MNVFTWDRLTNGYYWLYSDANDAEPCMVEISGTTLMFTGNSNDQSTSEYQTQIFIRIDDAPKISRGILDQIAHAAFHKFHTVNQHSKFPFRIEGYWRRFEVIPPKDELPGANVRHYSNMQDADCPWPVPMEIAGFNVQAFIEKLVDTEDLAKEVKYRGYSYCRLTNENLGCSEFEYKGWKWPDGLAHYIRLGVPPSAAFYKFIMGADAEDGIMLPRYGRGDDE